MQASRTIDDTQEHVNKDQRTGRLADLPRRQFLEVSTGDVSLAQMRFISFKVNYLSALASFIRWLQLILNFFTTVVFDSLLREDSSAQRALRLRRAFERAGGSFIKLGI